MEKEDSIVPIIPTIMGLGKVTSGKDKVSSNSKTVIPTVANGLKTKCTVRANYIITTAPSILVII
jgi:outer membrane receptor for monomeric catechols